MIFLGFLIVTAAAVVKGNITGHHPKTGTCICVSGSGVNARSSPGLSTSVVATVNRGECYKFHGGLKTKEGYTWYQLQAVSGHNAWVAGNFLTTGSTSKCSGSSSSGLCIFEKVDTHVPPPAPFIIPCYLLRTGPNNMFLILVFKCYKRGACTARAKHMACDILNWHNSGRIHLWTVHPSGHHDHAYALNNIRDMCHGHKASRSHYKCSLCTSPAPGGHVCLNEQLLHYLHVLGSSGKYYHVNEIAGACHNCHSKHYYGRAVDLHNDARSAEYLRECVRLGGWGQDEGDHIHCQFNN